MKKTIFLVCMLTIFFILPSYACKLDGSEGIMPPNNLEIPAGAKSANNMTRRDFNHIIDQVLKVYKPLFKEMGGRIIVKKKWFNKTVNAYAQKKGKRFYVTMYGGLARHEVVTNDAFALVVCHEFGHHLGGAPRIYTAPWGWKVSNEGQADYFATQKCFKRVFAQDDNQRIVEQMEIPQQVSEKCSTVYSNANDIALCKRASMAGFSLANLFKTIRGLSDTLSFSTPDPHEVYTTYILHPLPQCRLDTYFQGALCSRDESAPVDFEDHRYNYCNSDDGDILGLRPRCWFNPERYHF